MQLLVQPPYKGVAVQRIRMWCRMMVTEQAQASAHVAGQCWLLTPKLLKHSAGAMLRVYLLGDGAGVWEGGVFSLYGELEV